MYFQKYYCSIGKNEDSISSICFLLLFYGKVSNSPFSLRLAAKKIKQVYHEEGFTKLWKGNSATILRVIPYSATQYSAFRGYSHLIMTDEYTPLTPLQRFIAGAGAGATATCLTYPLDFLRTRMAVREGQATYRNIGVAFKSILKGEVSVLKMAIMIRVFSLSIQVLMQLFLVSCPILVYRGWYSIQPDSFLKIM